MKKRLILAAAAAVAILSTNAGVNASGASGFLTRAIHMYGDGNYRGCLDQLSAIDSADLGTGLDADQMQLVAYYRAAAHVYINPAQAATMLEAFLADYPYSALRTEATILLGDCYYGSDYARAAEIYGSIPADALDNARRRDIDYRLAQCYLKTDNLSAAEPLLQSLRSTKQYGEAANFYLGYIAYARTEYTRAEQILRQVNPSQPPCDMADYYLSQICYIKSDYSEALRLAKNLLGRTGIDSRFVAETEYVAGMSSYQLGSDTQAVKYLKQYVSKVEVPQPSALYVLGLSEYNVGDYAKAIADLQPVTAHEDAMGQSAYLYIGQAYMHLGQYNDAALNFGKALKQNYDTGVQEAAYYNYAVASTHGGREPFANTVQIFTDFLKKFPNSQYAPEVQEYIINSYLTDNNYTAALASINQMSSPSRTTLAAKQRILYILGTRALAASDYSQALQYLTEARGLASYDSSTDIEVSLSLGEAFYRTGNYAKSVTELQRYLSKAPANAVNRPLAQYDLGYSLYAQGKYSEAAQYFRKAVADKSGLPETVVADAYNRLGDCYYKTSAFDKAAEAYDQAYRIAPKSGDYALFQQALMAGYQRRYDDKLQLLDRLQREFPSSALLPDALLETTECYIQQGNTDRALRTYRTLVETYPNTAQGRQGYLQMATVLINSGNRTAAKDAYREVIRRYPTSDEAAQAVEEMKRICTADGTITELMAFLRTVPTAPQFDESEIEQLAFDNAEQLYLTEYNIAPLLEFINTYPASTLCPRALAYLAEAEYAAGDLDSAYSHANTLVTRYPDNSFARDGLVYKALIEEERGQNPLALRTWKQLEQMASSAPTLLRARMGIIRTGRETGDLDDVLTASDRVLSSSGAGADDLAEATFSKGLVLYKRGDVQAARNLWQSIADDTDNLYGVQADYYLAESYYNAREYKLAKKWADKVVTSDTPHMYWMARCFILLSDIYTATGDSHKARNYLESVRDNYDGENQEEIQQLIDMRLRK